MEAQKFMNRYGLKKCWECDGVFFKHEYNANARATTSSKEVVVHTLSAGVAEDKPVTTPAITEA
jgi:hypothetical protein